MKRTRSAFIFGTVFLILLTLTGCISLPPVQDVEMAPAAEAAEPVQPAAAETMQPAAAEPEQAESQQIAPAAPGKEEPAEEMQSAPEAVKAVAEPVFIPEAEPVTEAAGEEMGAVTSFMPERDTREVHLISTSDVHGMIFPYNFISDSESSHSLMQVSTYVNELRQAGEEVVLLDDGDVLQGQPLVYYSNFIGTEDTHIVPEVNNAMGYDVSSVGNHDIEAGPEVYLKVASEARYPYVGANIVDAVSGEPLTEPYVIIERNGLRIAVLGLTTPGIPSWLPDNLYPGIRFTDMVEAAQKWMDVITSEEDPDLIVGLFHSGRGESGQEGELNENGAIQVAEQVDGFDLIFSGHDHHDTDMELISPSGKTVYLIGALDGARSVAHATVSFDEDDEITGIDAKTVWMDGIEADQALFETYSERFEEVKNWISREIGTITETISSRDSMFADSKFVDLIHSMQLELTEADISISAPLALDSRIKQGPVYVRDMFALYPYENLLYTMKLTGKELDMMAEYSYGKWFNQMKSLDDDLISFRRDSDGNLIFSERYNSYEGTTRYYNYDSFAGVNYVVDITKPEGNRVTFKTLSDGSRFDLNAEYTVAINSYRAQGGGGHLGAAGIDREEAEARRLSSTVRDLRYYLMMMFEEAGEVEPSLESNWLVIPSLWARSGMENSYDKLYGGK